MSSTVIPVLAQPKTGTPICCGGERGEVAPL